MVYNRGPHQRSQVPSVEVAGLEGMQKVNSRRALLSADKS